jgi:hypothetical protein
LNPTTTQPVALETLVINFGPDLTAIMRVWSPQTSPCTRCRICTAVNLAGSDREICYVTVHPDEVYRALFG